MILQTIAFDLNIHLPHVNVLQIMEKVDKDEHYRSLKSCAFYFATDVIAVTDWCLRYSAASMSIVIIYLMAAYANVRIERLFADFMTEGSPWYAQFDETMNEDKLREMERDFIQTYRNSCQFHYASKYNLRENRPPLDHPDVRKIERTRDARSHSPMINHQQVPDSTQNGRPRGYVPKDELTVERLNKERLVEEERRKRDHDRMAGRIDNSTSSEKRARIDPLSNNFVTSPSMTSSVSNGKLLPPPPIPPQLNYPPPPLGGYSTNNQQKSQMNRRPFEQMTTTSSGSPAFRASARAFDVAPMLTPPVAPKLQNLSDSDMDLEDGEVE
ncbi:hypothetical protein GCK72_008239 [Caenorhabditis remanei]|uniref:Cyclin N-terminal domain-containing protein n=1 Tax=Caenorhabditis remanei TaxID=31234 RepID=A0A6A5GZN8_CAERE|nr:hypothetical protein GCK72_008239 [Caenorhabditis remanei]KAF1759994.1 hypothetical protein GCK72_008239 [Caenorhabditis remanei]